MIQLDVIGIIPTPSLFLPHPLLVTLLHHFCLPIKANKSRHNLQHLFVLGGMYTQEIGKIRAYCSRLWQQEWNTETECIDFLHAASLESPIYSGQYFFTDKFVIFC